jgi:hypothetical protein
MIHACLTKQDPMIQIFEACYIPVRQTRQCFKYLNHVTSLCDMQDPILEIVLNSLNIEHQQVGRKIFIYFMNIIFL